MIYIDNIKGLDVGDIICFKKDCQPMYGKIISIQENTVFVKVTYCELCYYDPDVKDYVMNPRKLSYTKIDVTKEAVFYVPVFNKWDVEERRKEMKEYFRRAYGND